METYHLVASISCGEFIDYDCQQIGEEISFFLYHPFSHGKQSLSEENLRFTRFSLARKQDYLKTT